MDGPEHTTGKPPLQDHQACLALTSITFDHLPRDGSLGRRRRYSKGSLLWATDSADYSLYFLDRGQVTIMLDNGAGCEVIVRIIEPGEPFGELCYCAKRNQPRGNCAMASVDSEAIQIGLEDFLAHLQRKPDALSALAFTVCERLADAERRIAVLSYRGAEARLGRLLLQLASTRGVSSCTRQGKIKLPVGHEELARMAAMSRPHVSVTMSRLRKLELVHYDGGSQLTVDVARLTDHVNGQQTH